MTDDIFYKTLMDNLYDGVYFVDVNRNITYWNKGAERITGYSAKQMRGSFCFSNRLNHIDESGRHLCQDGCPLSASIADGKEHEAEVYLMHAEGHRVPVLVRVSPIRNQAGEIIGAVETFSDNSAAFKMKRKVNQLERSVLLDPLTAIGNRAYGDMKLRSALKESQIKYEPFGLLFLDIDHFKAFNDNYSHAVGDKVLQAVASTIRFNLRDTDTCARWGGEEFIIIVFNVDAAGLNAVANKLRALIAESVVMHEGEALRVTVSIGAALSKIDDTPESISTRADALMYRSKTEGRNRVTCEQP
ncbi:MAG: GGDEF domain-containing protein [Anaerolineales bacterium]